MRYVAAYLLATLGGSKNPTEADLEKILGSVGIEAENDKMKAVVSELKGKDLEALIAAGKFFLIWNNINVLWIMFLYWAIWKVQFS